MLLTGFGTYLLQTLHSKKLSNPAQLILTFHVCIFLRLTVYPVVAHNIWSDNGILTHKRKDPLLGIGVIDFAGSGVVHLTGGYTALIATWLLGPRKGRFHDQRGNKLPHPKPFPGHSKSLQMLGTFILWFGWYGFNAGSAIELGSEIRPAVIARSVVNTTLAGAASGVVSLFANLIAHERKTGEAIFKLSSLMNGCLAGLAAITGRYVVPFVYMIFVCNICNQ